jgi:Tat protein translocase TatB subunit
VNISFGEIIVILVIALLVIKPEQMPEVAHALGRFVKGIRDMFASIKNEMNDLVQVKEESEEKSEKR